MANSPEIASARNRWQESGLSDKHAAALKLEPLSPEAARALSPSFHPVESIKIPYFDFDGQPTDFYRIRYLGKLPGFAGLAKKPQRYAQEPGSLNEIYMPPLLDSTWREVASDPTQQIIITEGEFKAAAGCAAGLPTIGLGGVDVWRATKRGMDLLPALLEISWEGRSVVILFDSDAVNKPEVVRAQRSLAHALLNRGARPSLAVLPPGPNDAKQGLDDYLLSHTADDLQEVIQSSPGFEEGDALWEMNEEVVFVKSPGIIMVRATGQRMDAGTFVNAVYANRHYVEVSILSNNSIVRKTKPLARRWLTWEARAEVSRLTYAPGQPRLFDGQWNTWEGWGCQPKAGNIEPWNELLDFLFKSDPPARKWFEQWLAYPLQNPGTKLLTAAVVWGLHKGTGKTFIAYLMKDIYGSNFEEIENSDLKGNFNGWAENKQFIYGDEITGGEARVDADKLKRIITRETVTINQKFIPQYSLPDRANHFISSNHCDAIFLEDGDRRYFVHEVVGPPREDAFYAMLDAWRKGGGASALFHHLLTLDLTGFNPNGRAPETVAKRQMMQSSKSDLDAWVQSLLEDPMPHLRPLGDHASRKCEVFTCSQLLRCYDPDGRRKVTAMGMSRALQRAGLRSCNAGDTIKTKMGSQRLWPVRNVTEWPGRPVKEIAKHFDKFFGPIE